MKPLAVVPPGDGRATPTPPPPYARAMARQQRSLARQQAGDGAVPASKRSSCTRAQIARTHARVAHLRTDALHKLTTRLAKTHGTIVVEDLNVAGKTSRPAPPPEPDRPRHHLRNGARAKSGLNRAILDASPPELRRQLSYKCEWYGCRLVG